MSRPCDETSCHCDEPVRIVVPMLFSADYGGSNKQVQKPIEKECGLEIAREEETQHQMFHNGCL